MPLTMADLNRIFSIVRVGGNEETRLFLGKLGFVPGTEVSVVSEVNGNIIVNIKDTRVAIGREQAKKILVSEAGG